MLPDGSAGELKFKLANPAHFPAKMFARSLLRSPAVAGRRTFTASVVARSDALQLVSCRFFSVRASLIRRTQHRDSAHNNASIPFALSAANSAIATEIISRYPSNYKKAAVIPLLEVAQKQNKGWCSISVMNHIATLLEMPPMRVYEVATFYTMFNRSVYAPRTVHATPSHCHQSLRRISADESQSS